MKTGVNFGVSSAGGGEEKLKRALALIRSKSAYVGVPSEKAQRPKEPINNAELLYVHTMGSPARNIPARSVLAPAVEAKDNREHIVDALKAAGEAALKGNKQAYEDELMRAALEAQNAARAWFTDARNSWAPNTPETIQRKGSDRPLIDTGEMRKSIIGIVGAS